MSEVQKIINESMDENVGPLISDITEEKLSLVRSVNFAGAGLSVAAIVAFATLSSLSITLEIALFLFSISIPLYVMMALVAENYIWAGNKSYKSYKELMYNWKILLSVMVAYCSSALAVVLVIFHLSFIAGLSIVVTSIFAYRLNSKIQTELLSIIKSEE
ncbi:hypothetical protein [Vibrio navarrensis]|uniref:hypothetical protein n=1 Tax=Vibrio navarrensis TaxID=29495 RepID=UPI0013027B20|nr:hypothetical protein [Vibrio navarrensis]